MSRCTGHCCREFVLHLQDVLLCVLTPERAGDDGPKIGSMITFVRRIKPGEIGLAGHVVSGDDELIWTCKHFDRESGDCTNYENRPNMCRDYPYGRECAMPGCTSEVRRRFHLPMFHEAR